VTLTVHEKTSVVRTQPEGSLAAGAHNLLWNGRDDAGAVVPHGPYTVRVTTTRPSPDAAVTLTAVLEKAVYVGPRRPDAVLADR
jgi:flagellar hook assembly protein FlgD